MIAIAIIFFIYIALIASWLLSIKSVKKSQPEADSFLPTVSVIVAFRNEMNNLHNLLTCFSKQTYPKQQVEYIFVNDHSEDNGDDFIKESNILNGYSFKVLSLSDQEGKKAAIELGVKSAKSEMIIVTDADCTMESEWLACISRWFVTCKASLLIGPVKLISNGTWFQNLQAFEFSTLMGATLGMASLKRPILSNGANFAFLRSEFMRINPYEANYHINTGDDIFLLHELKKEPEVRGKIFFVNDKQALVTTQAKQKLGAFLTQRIRWASKSKNFNDFDTILVGGLVFSINLVLVITLILVLIGHFHYLFLVFLFLLKWIIDLIFIQKVPSWLRGRKLLRSSIMLSCIYPFYSIGIALLSLFYKPKWKGRKI